MMLRVLALLSVTMLTGCDDPTIAVHGDSTAIASRDGLAKAYNLAPSLDGKRWWAVLGKSYNPSRNVFNDGVGGQSIMTLRDKMVADVRHNALLTIIYDRRNEGERADDYVAALSAAIETLKTDKFLILPQVPKSIGVPEDDDQVAAMAEIDAAVIARWPSNTFSLRERAAFISALSMDDTRFDGLHRNAKGQLIEAEFIGAWLADRGW